MKNTYKRNLSIGFGLSLLILMISSVASFVSINNLINSIDDVNHTNTVKQKLEKIMSTTKDAETGQRGYLISGNEEYLKPYFGSRKKTFELIEEVELMTADNNYQQENCIRLRLLSNKRYDLLENLIAVKDREGEYTHLMDEGRAAMDEMREVINKMIFTEQNLLERRNERLTTASFYTPALIIIAAILSFIISILFYIRLTKDFDERVKLYQQLKESEKDLADRIDLIQIVSEKISAGDYSTRIDDERRDSLGNISFYLNKMATALQTAFDKIKNRERFQAGIAGLNEVIVGEKDVHQLSNDILEYICNYTSSQVGAIYIHNNNHLELSGSYALVKEEKRSLIKVGEGSVGQCAASRKPMILKDIPEDSLSISYSSAEFKPKNILLYPVMHEGNLKCIIEIGSIRDLCNQEMDLLENSATNIGLGIFSAQNRTKLQELLEETQSQTEELQSQHKELEELNAEMESQTQKLQVSEEELKVQQEELMQSNYELEERTKLLEERNDTILERNKEIEKKAEELALSTKYKSEFLANMSHELRTPLNSILLLSRLMSENTERNLSLEQIEYARVIQSSGNGLLTLIDEILDLSRIEAGKMNLEYAELRIKDLISDLESMFLPLAKEKKIGLNVIIDSNVPETIHTDRMRLDQILKNLLSNALKFTSKGFIEIHVKKETGTHKIDFYVRDSGIGISQDKQDLIFEAFQQADGSTRRKFGGTGLGLSISRELVKLLGGTIGVSSMVDEGSEFMVSIPETRFDSVNASPGLLKKSTDQISINSNIEKISSFVSDIIPEEIPDDRDHIIPRDRVIMIVEDDVMFASLLQKFAREKGYKTVVLVRGDQVIDAVNQYNPVAILLDIVLPMRSGWDIIEELKSDPYKRHIPVHVMSSMEMKRESLMKGAVDFINKPFALDKMNHVFQTIEDALKNDEKKVIIIEENAKHAKALAYYLENFNIKTEIAKSIKDGAKSIKKRQVNCVILDMGIPASSAYETLELVKGNSDLEDLPVIIFTGKSLSKPEELKIKQYANSIVVKTAQSYQRILDEVAIFLHMVEDRSQEKKGTKLLGTDGILKDKTVLVADDDIRNIYSLTKALEQHQMKIVVATDGKDALDKMENHPEIDIVLMDMMMPELDGYETTARIREIKKYDHIPVLAVTAKAMMGDREKCISAGASDYISKPIDIDQLVSLLRVWLYDKS